MASEDFAGSGALSANWSQQYSDAITRSSGVGANVTSGDAGAIYTGATWANDQSAQCIRPTIANYAGPIVRGSNSSTNHYRVQGNGSAEQIIVLRNAGSDNFLQFTGEIPVDTNDVFLLDVTGTTLKTYVNGVQRGTDQVDSTLSSGYPGVWVTWGAGDTVDDWSATGDTIDFNGIFLLEDDSLGFENEADTDYIVGESYVAGLTFTATGGITPVGTLQIQPRRFFAGGMTPAGGLTRRPGLFLSGGNTPAGALIWGLLHARSYTGGITPVGVVAWRTILGRAFTGGITPVGEIVKRVNLSLAGSLTPSATLVRQPRLSKEGSITPTATLTKHTARSFLGGITPAGVLTSTKVSLVSLTGAITSIVGVINSVYIPYVPPSGGGVSQMLNVFRRRKRRG